MTLSYNFFVRERTEEQDGLPKASESRCWFDDSAISLTGLFESVLDVKWLDFVHINKINRIQVRFIQPEAHCTRKAFKTTWGKNVTGFERSRLINKLADLIERDAQELAELESLNNGKPVRIARLSMIPRTETSQAHTCFRDFDIGDTIQCLRYYAGWADKLIGQVWTHLQIHLRRSHSD